METEAAHYHLMILLLSLQWEAFNNISHDDVHSPAALATDDPLTATTSSIEEPQGLFRAAFHQRSHFHDSSGTMSLQYGREAESCREKETNPD